MMESQFLRPQLHKLSRRCNIAIILHTYVYQENYVDSVEVLKELIFRFSKVDGSVFRALTCYVIY